MYIESRERAYSIVPHQNLFIILKIFTFHSFCSVFRISKSSKHFTKEAHDPRRIGKVLISFLKYNLSSKNYFDSAPGKSFKRLIENIKNTRMPRTSYTVPPSFRVVRGLLPGLFAFKSFT